jgi:hypothetical protein
MEEKWILLVTKLNQLTQQGGLKWELESAPPQKVSFFSTTSYICRHDDKGFRLTRLESPLSNSPDQYRLYIVDAQRKSIWDVPVVPGLKDLYEAVRYKTAGVDDFINSIVGKK